MSMKPYYQDATTTIYHGDATEIVPLLGPVDVVLADPPYGIDGSRGTINKARARGLYEASFVDDENYIREAVVPLVESLIASVDCVVVTPGNRCLSFYPPADSFGAFYQPAAVALQTFGNLDAQPILYYGKNASGKNMGVPCSYRLTETPEKNGHPCPKPLRAWRKLLANVSLPGQTVLDPFMGSGTTLRAAKDLNRKSIGIEIEERFCDMAVRRLGQEVLDLGA